MSKLISIILAVSFSFLLFVGMTFLIKPKTMEVVEEASVPPITITYEVVDDEPEIRKYPLPEEPKEPEQPKILTDDVIPNKPDKVALFSDNLPTMTNVTRLGTIELANLMGSENNDVPGPKVRINPKYPIEAATKGIEGYVTLTFDISETGTTENISVVDSHPRNVFVKEAKRALRKWRYSPKIVDEQAVVQSGQKITLQFNLESELL